MTEYIEMTVFPNKEEKERRTADYNTKSENAKRVIKQLFDCYKGLIEKKFQKQSFVFTSLTTDDVEQINSGAHGLAQVKIFLGELNSIENDLGNLLKFLIENAHWGEASSNLTLLCLDIILGGVDLQSALDNFKSKPNKPYAGLEKLNFSKPIAGETYQAIIRVTALASYIKVNEIKPLSDLTEVSTTMLTIALTKEREENAAELARAQAALVY